MKEKVSTETNPIKEPESKTSTDAGSNLCEKDKEKKREDELSELYKLKVPFPSALKASFSYKKQRVCNEELMKLFK